MLLRINNFDKSNVINVLIFFFLISTSEICHYEYYNHNISTHRASYKLTFVRMISTVEFCFPWEIGMNRTQTQIIINNSA